jgi:hypothetical protein
MNPEDRAGHVAQYLLIPGLRRQAVVDVEHHEAVAREAVRDPPVAPLVHAHETAAVYVDDGRERSGSGGWSDDVKGLLLLIVAAVGHVARQACGSRFESIEHEEAAEELHYTSDDPHEAVMELAQTLTARRIASLTDEYIVGDSAGQ